MGQNRVGRFGEKQMNIATYQGIVENGKVHLPPNIRLPDKTKVYVVVPAKEISAWMIVSRGRQ